MGRRICMGNYWQTSLNATWLNPLLLGATSLIRAQYVPAELVVKVVVTI